MGWPQNAPAAPATTHGTPTDPKTPSTPPSVAGIGKADDIARALARLTADNRALTDQVTRLQEDSTARVIVERMVKILGAQGVDVRDLLDMVVELQSEMRKAVDRREASQKALEEARHESFTRSGRAMQQIRRILLLGDEVSDQDVVEEVDRVAVQAGKPMVDRVGFVNNWHIEKPYMVKVSEHPDEWYTPKDQPDPTVTITLVFRAPRSECEQIRSKVEGRTAMRVRLEPRPAKEWRT